MSARQLIEAAIFEKYDHLILGWVDQGVVHVVPPFDPDHQSRYHHPDEVEHLERFRYDKDTGAVVWTDDASLEAQHATENYLSRRGHKFRQHRSNFGKLAVA